MKATPKTPISTRKSTLLARQDYLTTRLATIETELDSHQNPDWEELSIEREDDEVLEATGLSAQQELRQIAAALNRIEAGTYGTCTKCGADIGEARLDVLPYTPFCRDCAT
jgi:RNA polymerase-binding transcription factor DksA